MSLPVAPAIPVSTHSLNSGLGAGKAVSSSEDKQAAKGKEFSFWDLVDIVNPLQHIPIVNNIYRKVTGDEINNFGRIAGGAIFGGFIGAAIGGVNAIAVQESGHDVGEIAMIKTGLMEDKKIAATPAKVPENIPMIEVRPMAKKAVDTKDQIVWDQPRSVAVQLAEKPAAPIVEKKVEVAAALPTPKDLNDIEPGSNEAIEPPEKVDIPNNMMQALAKYEAMQKTKAPTSEIKAVSANVPQFAPDISQQVAAASARPYQGFRRY